MTATHEPERHAPSSISSTAVQNPNYALLERLSRRALRRHALNERERLVAEIVLDFSYAIARPAALIPRQDLFVTLTGISKGNVSTVLGSLEAARILHIIRAEALYTFLPDSSTWKVKSRLASDAHNAAADRAETWLIETARISPEQLHLLPPFPDLTLLLAAEAREEITHRGEPASGRDDQHDASNRGQSAHDRGGDSAINHATHGGDIPEDSEILHRLIAASLEVPESGTVAQHSSRSCGNSTVPESGTCATPHDRTPRNTVPDSGTPINALVETTSPINVINGRCGAGRLMIPRRAPKPKLEAELLSEAGHILGCMDRWGGRWRLAIRYSPVAVREALGNVRLRKASGGKVRDWGAFAFDEFARISGLKPQRKNH